MAQKFLKEVVGIIVGKQAEAIADLLDSTKHVNEFIIAKKLDITINQTRNMLYKLADYGLVSSIRKKDKRKGWYTYFWKWETLKALEFLKGVLLAQLDQLNAQIKSRETKQFYVCQLCNVEFNEENALLRDFTCAECGSVFVLKDNAPVVKELHKQTAKLERDLDMVEEERVKEEEKEGKLREKENKKRDSDIAQKRSEAREKSKKTRLAAKAASEKISSKSGKSKKTVSKKTAPMATKKKTKKVAPKKKISAKNPSSRAKKSIAKKTSASSRAKSGRKKR